MSEVNVRHGDIVWCVKIHEDELNSIPGRQQDSRTKPNGAQEKVNWYEVSGKLRPALVLRARDDISDAIVWYTCCTEPRCGKSDEITKLMPQGLNTDKQTFLRHHAADIRRVPRKGAWIGDRIITLDRTVTDGYLKQIERFPFMRL